MVSWSQEGLLRCAALVLAASSIIGAPARADDAAVKTETVAGGYRLSFATNDGSDPSSVRKRFIATADKLCAQAGTNFGKEVVVRSDDATAPMLFTVPVTCGPKPAAAPGPTPPTPPGPPRQ